MIREFLSWIDRWSNEGFDPVRKAWLFRGHENDDDVSLRIAGAMQSGKFKGLDSEGGVCIVQDGQAKTVSLIDFFTPEFVEASS